MNRREIFIWLIVVTFFVIGCDKQEELDCQCGSNEKILNAEVVFIAPSSGSDTIYSNDLAPVIQVINTGTINIPSMSLSYTIDSSVTLGAYSTDWCL